VVSYAGASKAAKSQERAAGQVSDASMYAADLSYELGNKELDFAKEQYAGSKVLADRVANSQITGMDENNARARDYSEYEKATFRPLEQGLVNDANNFNTEVHREGLATRAGADAGEAFSNTQAMNARSMSAMGVNPNSGRFSGTANRSALGLAANRTGAMNNTRMQADQLGWAKKMDAAGLGRGLAGASTGAYGVASSLGNSAVQNTMAPGMAAMQGMSQGTNTIMSGANNATNAAMGLLNQPNYQAQAMTAMGGSLMGAGMTGLMK
jgi:hypothetical protein